MQAGLAPSIDLLVSPTTPRPGENVTLSLQSFSTDLAKANIMWYMDGVLLGNSIGNTKISVRAKNKLGSETNIRVSITTPDGYSTEKDASLVPEDLDLIMEPAGYTPPFYKGKALYTPQGVGTIAALPQIVDGNGIRVSTKDILYVWKKDGRVIPDTSGLGRDRFAFSGSVPIRPIQIDVEASTKDGSIKLTRSAYLDSSNPTLLFYENNPLYGILFNQAIVGEKTLTDAEINIFAAPYFMTANAANNFALNYDWNMNNRSIDTPAGQNFLVLRNEGKEGIATMGVSVTNQGRIFQSTSGSMSVRFGAIQNTNASNNQTTF